METDVGSDLAGRADPSGGRRAETPSWMFADCQFRLNRHCWLKTAARTGLAVRLAECRVPAGGRTKGIRWPDAPGQVGSKKKLLRVKNTP